MLVQSSWKVRNSVFSPIELTEGLRLRPSFEARKQCTAKKSTCSESRFLSSSARLECIQHNWLSMRGTGPQWSEVTFVSVGLLPQHPQHLLQRSPEGHSDWSCQQLQSYALKVYDLPTMLCTMHPSLLLPPSALVCQETSSTWISCC